MRSLDAMSKESFARDFKQEPSEQDIVQCGYTLMQEAGLALFQFIQAKAIEPIAIFIGGGNNGGDGLVLAKHLIQAGTPSTVFSLAHTDKFKNEAKLALDDFVNAGGTLCEVTNPDGTFRDISNLINGFKLIVDCMLGNGSKGELRKEFADAVKTINASGIPVIAADAPTGYDSYAHVCNEICIHASETMLFGFPRLDAYTKDGCKAFGKVTIAPLGYPEKIVKQLGENVYLATEELIPQLLPKRDEWGDKRVQGCPLIIAGSKDMPGAAALCTEAALRSGAGLVTLASPQAIMPVLKVKLSEPVFCSLDDAGKADAHKSENDNKSGNGDKSGNGGNSVGTLQPNHLPTILQKANHTSANAIGPGLSTHPDTVRALLELLPQLTTPTVIDADALNAIATLNENEPTCDGAAIDFLQKIKAPAILTPHEREFARLFGRLPEKNIDIPERLKNIAKSTNKAILLKGATTYIASTDGDIYILPVANSGMAKGGSGDVLTGIIVALLAQGLSITDAAVLGALLHQKAGRITREKLGVFSMLPSDILKTLPLAFER